MRFVPLALLFTACMTPRSVMQMQSAGQGGRGAIEIGVGTGVGYAQEARPLPGAVVAATGSSSWIVPALEGNAQFGLNDHVGVNAHFSPAGLQPGLKITVTKARQAAQFALMPQFAVGYGQFRTASYSTNADGTITESGAQATNALTFLGGLRVMVSHQIGLFAGIGYDFIATRSVRAIAGSMTAVPITDSTNTLQHSLMANLGWSVPVGWLRIRPEISFAVQPYIYQGFSTETTAASAHGGFGWGLIAGFSLAVATPKSTKDEGAEEDEKNVGPAEEVPQRDEEERRPESEE